MEIKLKNVLVSEALSKETTAFTANLYINNVNAGMAGNQGRGGPTTYNPIGNKGRTLIEEAEEYCRALPQRILGDPPRKGDPMILKMDLEQYIDKLVREHLEKRYVAQDLKKIEKYQVDSIVYGVPGHWIARLHYNTPLDRWWDDVALIAMLRSDVREMVLPKLGRDGMILNTNIPEEIMKVLDISTGKIAPSIEKEKFPKPVQKATGSRKKGKSKGIK